MSDEAIKKRRARAKARAIAHYRGMNYSIVMSDDRPFAFIAVRLTDIRFVCVVVDRITSDDLKSVQGRESPAGCVPEIFCQKETRFEIREVRE